MEPLLAVSCIQILRYPDRGGGYSTQKEEEDQDDNNKDDNDPPLAARWQQNMESWRNDKKEDRCLDGGINVGNLNGRDVMSK